MHWQFTLDGLQIESAVGLPLSRSYVLVFHHTFKPTVCKAAVGNKRALEVSALSVAKCFVLLRCCTTCRTLLGYCKRALCCTCQLDMLTTVIDMRESYSIACYGVPSIGGFCSTLAQKASFSHILVTTFIL